MCGIAGIVNFTVERPDVAIVRKMVNVMRHRGPDGEGFYNDRHVAFGHVRLSIIDVAGSSQPLSNEDGTVWVTFNGEIYNYRQLREKLISLGHRFRTNGDTETLVHLYEEYGPKMVDHLIGMFAFAIWDSSNQSLLLVRDRMGIKPLYYSQKGDEFIFGSEPKAILQHPGVDCHPSSEGIWHYLTYRSVPSPGTLFQGITKLRPGYMLLLNRNGCVERSYWDIPLYPERAKVTGRSGNALQSIEEQVESMLFQSVKRRLISDVPLGAFLSGGVDSSLIVAMMSKLTNASVKTYSVGFRNFASSELEYAKVVATQYQTDHHELVLEGDCFAEHLEKLTWLRDSPLSEPADVPLYLLANMAQKDVKVLLSGEGSDELFGGYPKYAWDRFSGVVNFLPKSLTGYIGRQLPASFRRVEIALKSLCEKDPADRWAQWFSPFTQVEKEKLFLSRNSWQNPTREYVGLAKGCDPLDAMLYTDCKLWLPDNLLDRGDRMTMGASVEGRVPFLDHELVEFAFCLPVNVKVKALTCKWLVKQIAFKYLPGHIVNRRKVGFSVPLAQWFRGKLRDMCRGWICRRDGLVRQILSYEELQRILEDHDRKRKDNSMKIWTLLGLAIWDDIFCKNGVQKHNKVETNTVQ
ncbi:MAG: asparagine synthase (glutamine-hydrolyzing) [Sedimentisphaerales bacterium]|jgi:asparagine synthase (glutamine-hydrolysing)